MPSVEIQTSQHIFAYQLKILQYTFLKVVIAPDKNLLSNRKMLIFFCRICLNSAMYRINHMYSDRQAWANSIDSDETPQNVASHLGLHCLPLTQQFLDTTAGSELYWFKL